ncbi:MAG: polysaccharide deacetylase family protein [Luteitalea sp.]|nr:polysaccharide deacetylase family protein [Luteitalea sp.]
MLWLLLIGLGATVLAHTAPFPFVLDYGFRSRAVWKMPTQPGDKVVYLTFDDGPNPAATPALLDALRDNDARATFFVIDSHITEQTAPIVARMVAEGHDVALHSNERSLMFRTPEALAEQLGQAAQHIEQITGQPPCAAFRPHGGLRGGSMFRGLGRLGYRLVGWSWNLWDWNWFRRPRAETIVSRLLENIDSGEIVVLHDGDDKQRRADRRYAVETVRQLVPALAERGFRFGTICE